MIYIRTYVSLKPKYCPSWIPRHYCEFEKSAWICYNAVTNNFPILARPPGSASFVLDGTSLDDVYLSAWHISNANLTKLAGILANGSFVINATVDPFGEFLDIRFKIFDFYY